MAHAALLQPNWQTKKFIICHLLALLLIGLWAWPVFHQLAIEFDTYLFKLLNGSLAKSSVWASFWAIASTRFFDLLVAIILLLFLIKPDWLYEASLVRQAFFALAAIMLLEVVIRIIFTKVISSMGWQHASPSIALDDVYRLSDHVATIKDKLEIKDSSSRSFPGDHASILLIWAMFLSCFARKFNQYFIIWLIAIIFMMPRLVAGAHWASDDYIGGVLLALLALAWGVYTPFAAKISGWFVNKTSIIFSQLQKIPLINKFAIVRLPSDL